MFAIGGGDIVINVVITITIWHYVTSVYLAGYVSLAYLFKRYLQTCRHDTLFKPIVNINICLCVCARARNFLWFGLSEASLLLFYPKLPTKQKILHFIIPQDV